MLRGLYTAWSGLVNEQNRMDVMTNNLANASTVGFKKEGSTSQSFDDVLTVKIKDASVGLSTVQRMGIRNPGVKIGENYTDYSQGSFRDTGNTYDLALEGSGFFALDYKNKSGDIKQLYTRSGQFALNEQGYLVNQDGDFLLDTRNRHIRMDPLKDTEISADGRITQDGVEIAQIQIADFQDYNYLQKYGETYFVPLEDAELISPVRGENVVNTKIRSGYLEMSNVQIVSEMVNLIAISRAYEANQKLVQTYDDSLEIAVTQLGRISS